MHLPMNPPGSRPPLVQPRLREAGFSVIEGLIAALLLLIVTLGILPLFSRAMNNNVKGNDSTRQSNAAIDAFESAVALPFNSGDMTVAAGTTETVVTETLALKKVASPTGGEDLALSMRWELPGSLVTGDVRVLDRQRTVRQHSFDDFADNQTFDFPLDGAAEPRLVHLKVVELALQDSTGASPLAYRLRTIQAY